MTRLAPGLQVAVYRAFSALRLHGALPLVKPDSGLELSRCRASRVAEQASCIQDPIGGPLEGAEPTVCCGLVRWRLPGWKTSGGIGYAGTSEILRGSARSRSLR